MLNLLALPAISPAHSRVLNVIARTRPQWLISGETSADIPISISPVEPDTRLQNDAWIASYDFTGSRIALTFDKHIIERALENHGVCPALEDVPPPLAAALMETVLRICLDALSSLFGTKGQISGISREVSELHGVCHFCIGKEGSAGSFPGLMSCDESGARLIEKAVLLCPPQNQNDIAQIPVPVEIRIGSTKLSFSIFQRLIPGCIILFDQTYYSAEGKILLNLGGRFCLRGHLNDNTIFLTKGPTAMLPDMPSPQTTSTSAENVAERITEPPENDSIPVGDFHSIEVNLTFDLGTHQIPFSELQTLAAGYVFDLGRDARRQVQIKANGRLIGYGDLVAIDDRTGVRIHKIFGQTNT